MVQVPTTWNPADLGPKLGISGSSSAGAPPSPSSLSSGSWPFLGAPSHSRGCPLEDPANSEELGEQPEGRRTSNGRGWGPQAGQESASSSSHLRSCLTPGTKPVGSARLFLTAAQGSHAVPAQSLCGLANECKRGCPPTGTRPEGVGCAQPA